MKGIILENPLHYKAFRRLLLGRSLGVLSRQIIFVTTGWEIYERTGSTWALGLVGLVQVIPVVLLAIPAGIVVDQGDRKKIAGLSQLSFSLLAAGLALQSYLSAPLWAIYSLLFLSGCVQAFNAPASSSLLPRLVPQEALNKANAWSSSVFNLSAISGPALGGFLIALTHGATIPYASAVFGSLCYALALFGLTLLPAPALNEAELKASAESKRDWRSGLRFVFGSKLLLPALTLDMFSVLFAGVTALLPVFAKDVLHVGPSGLGWLRSAPALGAFLMAIILTRIPPWRRPGRVLLFVVALFGLASLGFGLSRNFYLSYGLLLLGGVLDEISVVIRITLEQMVTPDHMRGRVSSIHYVFIGLSNELGEFESGVAAGLLGPVGAVVFGGVTTLIVVSSVAWRWPNLLRLGPLHELRPEQN
jgi:MFS family permease